MGIWIRSQNKGVLVNANDIWVDDKKVVANVTPPDGEPFIWLGIYNSEAEALKVLDMIQDKVRPEYKIDLFDGKSVEIPRYSDPVFQMPEAGFSGEE